MLLIVARSNFSNKESKYQTFSVEWLHLTKQLYLPLTRTEGSYLDGLWVGSDVQVLSRHDGTQEVLGRTEPLPVLDRRQQPAQACSQPI